MAFSWGSVIQGATSAVQGAVKRRADNRKAKSGKEMAAAITKKESKGGAIVKSRPQIQAITKVIPTQKLVPSLSLSTESTGVSSIDKVLDSIDSRIVSITSTIKNTSKIQQKSVKDEAKQIDKRKKRMRESILENTSRFINTLRSKVPSGMKSTWDSIRKFLTNIVLGSLVLYIVKQWDTLVAWYEKTIERIKELWTKLDPVVSTIWNFLKWFTRFTVDWTARLMGIKEPDTKPISDNLKEIGKKMAGIGELFKGFTGIVDKLRGVEKSDIMEEGNIMPSMHHDAPPPAEVRSEETVSPKKVYDYLINKGVSDNHARGMLANIQAESGFRSGVMGDNGTSGGLFQHHATRFDAMKSFVGKDWRTNWKKQIDFALQEREGKSYLKKQFSSPQEASKDFTLNFEIPANANQKAKDRIKNLGTFKLSQGLDSFTSYEGQSASNTIIITNPASSSSGGNGEGKVVLLPIPLQNSALDMASNLHQYQLQTT